MGDRIEESEASDRGGDYRVLRAEWFWTLALSLAITSPLFLAVRLIVHHSGQIAAGLGCHPDIVEGACFILAIMFALSPVLWDETPRRGLPYFDRWLVGVMVATGLGAFHCYLATSARDRWSMSGPIVLGALLIAGLLFFVRWLDRNDPAGIARIWRQEAGSQPGMKPEEKFGADGLDCD